MALGLPSKVKQDMVIEVPEEVFGIKKYEATVVRNWNVASFIKEFVVAIPEEMDYKAGGIFKLKSRNVKFHIKTLIFLLTLRSTLMTPTSFNSNGTSLASGISR